MRTVTYRLADLQRASISIGFVGENEYTRVQFDALKVFEEYPSAIPSLSVVNPSGTAYPVVTTRDGDYVIWDVQDSDLVAQGRGEAQLTFSSNGVVVKSYVFRTIIDRSIVADGETPDPVQNWLDEAAEMLEELEDVVPPGGTQGQVMGKLSNDDYDIGWIDQTGGGGGGTTNYNALSNKPQIGGVELQGDKSLHELGIAAESSIPDVTGKADKVTGGTENNFTALDANGNIKDSGKKASDFITSHQDISGKADKVASSTNGNFAGLDSNGNLTDSGKKASDFATPSDVNAKYTKPGTGIPSSDLASAVQTSLGKADTAYQKPSGGIPASDMENGAIPDPTSIIDDTAGDGDTDKVLSADKVTEELTSLSSAITTIDSCIAYPGGRTALTYNGDGQIYDKNDTANVTSPTQNANWRYAVIECLPGDMFLVNANGGGDGRAWAFVAENGIVLSRSEASVNVRDAVITAPEKTKWLVLNDKKSGETSYKLEYKYLSGIVSQQQNDMNKLLDASYKTEKVQYETSDGYINTTGTSLTELYTPSGSNLWRHAIVPCEEGDLFLINAVAVNEASKRPFAFVSVNGEFISKYTESYLCANVFVSAPENAAYLIINDRKPGVDSYCVRKGLAVINKNEEALDATFGIGVNKGRFQNVSNPDSLVLLHFSDVHGSSENMRDVFAVKRYLGDVLDDTICTGDILKSYASDSINFWNRNSDGTILTCIGNHDVKISGTTGYISNQPTEAELYAKFMQNYISKWGTVEHSNNNLYYYKDYAEKNVRLIVLNLLYPSSEKTTEQNTWLANALAGAKTAGYGVVIAQHYYPVSGTKISCTFSCEYNFPSSMSNPGNYMYNGDALTTYQATVQDFIDNGGNFVCWLAGHKHADFIAYHPTYPKQAFIGVGCATVVDKSDEVEFTSDMRRVAGTKSFDCMNVMAVDPANKKIRIIRIGCDRDFLGRHRGTLTLDYSTSPATVVYND